MPYIIEQRRKELSIPSNPEIGIPETPGELNFVLTRHIIETPGFLPNPPLYKKLKYECNLYLEAHKLSYGVINDIIGALEGAKLEYGRRKNIPAHESDDTIKVIDSVKIAFYRDVVAP
ncbi:MAG: hypothetical protein R3321_14990, partial [Nitrososphaeraceae archaeon]|nr:hypothetical protein [Nitrososphaeraceae archaeon]